MKNIWVLALCLVSTGAIARDDNFGSDPKIKCDREGNCADELQSKVARQPALDARITINHANFHEESSQYIITGHIEGKTDENQFVCELQETRVNWDFQSTETTIDCGDSLKAVLSTGRYFFYPVLNVVIKKANSSVGSLRAYL